MGKIINNIQKQEEERINLMKDSVMKILVFETSYVKNIEYDIEIISEKMKKVNGIQYIEDVILNNKTKRQKIQKLKYEENTTFVQKVIY